MRVIGVDLAADEKNPTGIAELEEDKVKTFTIMKDSEIIDFIKRFKPNVVVIDAPLTTSEKPFRPAEREMQQLGFKLLPLNIPSMKKLSERGRHLKYIIKRFCEVIETHPNSAKKILGIKDAKELKKVRIMNIIKNEHEKDAIICAVVGVFYLENQYQEFGDEESGKIILPRV